MDSQDLQNRFSYHSPRDQATTAAHERIRSECYHLANKLNGLLPDGREKSLAITHLEDVMMWANASVARAPTSHGG